ncbi:MAG: hypothetical protein J5I98_12645 [Phaeodactylibacter sp.]|nr:hypothetical protein [Phaeodactylibacter sp.]
MDRVDLESILQPETALERRLIQDPEFRRGLGWGIPRFGHPEGEVYKHIREVLDNIDRFDISADEREKLRLITFVHDTFKHLEDKSYPRDWSKHHGVYARRFLERHYDDPVVLRIVELHDEAYYAWRHKHLYHQHWEGTERLRRLLDAMGDDIQLYYLFFKADTQTGDKNQAPLKWFEMVVKDIEVVPSVW